MGVLNFKSVGDYTIVFVNPDSADENMIQEKLNQVAKVFKEKYQKKVKSYYVPDELFQNFNEDMYKLGLVPKDRLQSTRQYFVTDQGKSEEMSTSLIDRFKKKFNSLVKKN